MVKRLFLAFSGVVDLLVLDQLSKWYMEGSETWTLVPGWVHIRYVENPGIAFSLPLEGVLLQVVTVVCIVGMLFLMYQKRVWENVFLLISCVFLLSGAIGNAIDRLFRGYVIDFISIGTFPVFNFADIFVNVGVWGIVAWLFWEESQNNHSL